MEMLAVFELQDFHPERRSFKLSESSQIGIPIRFITKTLLMYIALHHLPGIVLSSVLSGDVIIILAS